MTIQWFPGHMAKTRKLMTENLRLVDAVIELLDARLPKSSRNPLIDGLIGDKPRVLALTKADLAEEEYSRAWVAYFRRQGLSAFACDFKAANAKAGMKSLTGGLRAQAEELLARRKSRGISSRIIRVMVTGIPNVGKSTMINLFAGRAGTETGDRPGVTKGKQWIRLDRDLELLDMPGILWPNLEDREGARKLAVTGAIGDHAYDQLELALWAVAWLREKRPGRLAERYGIQEETPSVMEAPEALELPETPAAVTVPEEPETAVMPGKRDAAVSPRARGADAPEGEDEAKKGPETGGTAPAAYAILDAIARRRGLLRKGGIAETDKAAAILLDELRGGKLGRITWDELPG